MKKKVLNKKLNLKKEAIVSLSGSKMNEIIGGCQAPDISNTAVACSWAGFGEYLDCSTERCNC